MQQHFKLTSFTVYPQMSGLYSEVLDKLDKAKKNLVTEE